MSAAVCISASRILSHPFEAAGVASQNCRHGLNEIAAQLAPLHGCTGIELLQADTFNLHCFQTLTDTKFLLVTEPNTPDTEALLRER